MKKLISFIIALAIIVLTMADCAQAPATPAAPANDAPSAPAAEPGAPAAPDVERLNIITTIFAPYDFVRQIVGDKADVTMLLPPASESHSFEPTPQDIIKINDSDVFIYVGGDSDAWVDGILESVDVSNKEIITLMDCVEVVEEEVVEGMEPDEHDHAHEEEAGYAHEEDADHELEDEADHAHEEEADHAHEEEADHAHEEEADIAHEEEHAHEGEEAGHEEEHEHEGEIVYDEHVWTSPRNAKLIVQKISNALCALDTANSAAYQANTAAYLTELDALDAQFKEVVASAARKTIVFGDRFPFRYFADAYGLTYSAAFVGCSTETEASPATVKFLIDKVNAENIPVVFHIELGNENMTNAICEETGAKSLLLHACHNITRDDFLAGTTYVDLMKNNVETLREALA